MPPIGNISSQLLELLFGIVPFLIEGKEDLMAGLALNHYVHVCSVADAIDFMPDVAAEVCVTTRRHFQSPSDSRDTCRP